MWLAKNITCFTTSFVHCLLTLILVLCAYACWLFSRFSVVNKNPVWNVKELTCVDMNKNLKVTVLTNGNIGYLNPTSIAIILRLQTTILCNLWSVMVSLQQVLRKTGTVWDAVSTSWISKSNKSILHYQLVHKFHI